MIPLFRLEVLGEAGLRAADGREVRAVLQQPKRLALLAYLALNARGFHRRDSLVALFWPELDQDHARAALRRAVYFLRKSLGSETLTNRGDEEVGLAPGAVWCDAVEFESELAANRLTTSLELYRGPLLEGFYVAGAPEIERWLDGERRRLQDRAARAAWQAAEAAQPEPSQRALALRAIELAPEDEALLRRALLLLEKLGHRADAERAYQAFVDRLQADGLEPAAETRSIAGRVAARPGISRQPETSDLLMICPFSVRAGSSLHYLTEGMVELLSTALDGVGPLRTVDPHGLLAAWRQHRGDGADPTSETARRFGAHLIVKGSIVEAGGQIRISANLDDSSGRTLGSAVAQGSESDLFGLVDDLVRELLAARAIGPAARMARLAAATTESVTALKSYLQGEEAFRQGRTIEAMGAFQKAATTDPTFALAHYRLAGAFAGSALIGPARNASQDAMRHRARLGAHDRMLVAAQDAWLHGSTDDAERYYGTAVATRPDDLEAWYLLGDLLFHSNPYRGRSIRQARKPLERALALDPRHTGALAKLARIDALEGDLDALDRRGAGLLGQSPGSDQALPMRALLAYSRGEREEQGRILEELQRAPALAVGIAFADVALYGRDLAGAAELGRAFVEIARSAELKALCHVTLAHLALARGKIHEALAELEAASHFDAGFALTNRAFLLSLPFVSAPISVFEETVRALEEWDADAAPQNVSLPLALHNEIRPHLRRFLLGLLSVRRGDAAAAADWSEQLAELDVTPGEAPIIERYGRTLGAAIRALRGAPHEALQELEGMKSALWFQTAVASPFHAGGYERYLRASMLVDLARNSDALGWLESLVERSPWELVFKAPAALMMAELYRRTGHREKAGESLKVAAVVWQECDPLLKPRLQSAPVRE